MFSLQIYEQLTQDLRHGRKIAGTGTIADGSVGEIGGIDKDHRRQECRATIFLPPRETNQGDPKYEEGHKTNYQLAAKRLKVCPEHEGSSGSDL